MEVVFPMENHYFGVPVRIFPAGKNQHRPAPKPTTKNKCWPCWVTRKASICFCFVACVVFWYAGFSQQGSVVHSYTHVSTFTKKLLYYQYILEVFGPNRCCSCRSRRAHSDEQLAQIRGDVSDVFSLSQPTCTKVPNFPAATDSSSGWKQQSQPLWSHHGFHWDILLTT